MICGAICHLEGKMDIEKKITAMDRLLTASGCRTQIELAGLLGVKQASISGAKKKNIIPAEWLLKLLRLKGINPEWVLTGEEPKLLGDTAKDEAPAHVIHIQGVRPLKGATTQELVNELVRRALVEM